MLKVMTIVGTRPELIKMSRVIAELNEQVNHILVHSGQNFDYELNQLSFDEMEIRKPDYFLEAVGGNAAQTIAKVIEKSDEVMAKEQPDAILLDQRVPEELNRKVLDHLSDINMVLTEHARQYLLAEGIRPETIIKTGSHMEEVLDFYMPKVEKSEVLKKMKLESGKYFIVSAHREENVDDQSNLKDLLDTFNALTEKYNMPVIISMHPRTKKRIDELGYVSDNPLVQFMKPFGLMDYLKLQMEAYCVVSDSGTITEEASLLNLPAVTIRNAHERPEGMDQGTVVMCGLKKERVLEAVKVVVSQHSKEKRTFPIIPDYQGGAVSKQIVRIVLSYVDYINRTVWSKNQV